MTKDPRVFLKHILESIDWIEKDIPPLKEQVETMLKNSE